MRMRFLSIGFLVAALFLSAWGNVIAAAFCPSYASAHFCCIKHSSPPVPTQQATNHVNMAKMQMDDMDMGDMQMGEMEMEAAPESEPESGALDVETDNTSKHTTDAVAFSLPEGEACTHCISHSQSTPGPTSVTAGNPAQRSIESNPPPANIVAPSRPASSLSLSHLDHGPPGEIYPRHLLISVFRI